MCSNKTRGTRHFRSFPLLLLLPAPTPKTIKTSFSAIALQAAVKSASDWPKKNIAGKTPEMNFSCSFFRSPSLKIVSSFSVGKVTPFPQARICELTSCYHQQQTLRHKFEVVIVRSVWEDVIIIAQDAGRGG